MSFAEGSRVAIVAGTVVVGIARLAGVGREHVGIVTDAVAIGIARFGGIVGKRIVRVEHAIAVGIQVGIQRARDLQRVTDGRGTIRVQREQPVIAR